MDHPKKQVVIVGAGLSGLTAARYLLANDVSVQVLEAQDYVGGRIADFKSACGYSFSLGGDWFGSGETRFNQLLAELALEAAPVIPTGKTVVRLRGQTHVCSDEQGKWLSPIVVPADVVSEELEQAFNKIDKLSQQVSTTTPYLSSPEWDDLTLETWSRQTIKDDTQRKLFEIVVKQETGRELQETSLLYYLFVYQSTVKKLEDDRVVKGGTQRLIEQLLKQLNPYVKINTPINKMCQDEKRVELIAQDASFLADYAILAISPAVVNNIEYHPALPNNKQKLYATMQMGHIIKCVIIYQEPFWYRQALSGVIISDEGPLECTVDGCFQTECGALIGYITGDEAKKWSRRSRDQRKQAVLGQLESFFGKEARQPIEYMDINWPQSPWIQGAHYASMSPGAMVAYGKRLREPFGRIHWAGTETAENWCGTMEGAILAGERAAQEILEDIRLYENKSF